jgi:cytochrome oxidase assembly protein ShyY1
MSLLRTRRWLGFTVTVVVVIIAFGLLSLWQWHRAEDKRAQRLELQTAAAAAPVPLAAIERPAGGGIDPADEWRRVAVEGTYDPARQVVVRKRPLDARNGFWVMTPLTMASGGVVWVNRGWEPAGADALTTPPIPEPPAGPVTVTGYLRPFEAGDAKSNDGLPTGQVAAPAVAALPEVSDAYPAYVQLRESSPPQAGLVALPLETVDESRNISYAVQWLLFAGVAIGGWFFFLRREAKDDAEAAARDSVGPKNQAQNST